MDGVIKKVGVAGIESAIVTNSHVAFKPAVITNARSELRFIGPDGTRR